MVKHELFIASHSEKPEKENAVLCVECSEDYFTLLLADKHSGKLHYLKYFPIKEIPLISLSDQILFVINEDELLYDYQDNVKVIYNFPESSLIPSADYNIHINQAYIRMGFGDTSKGMVLNEKVPENELYNVYRIPGDLHSGLQQSKIGGKYWHIYSLMKSTYELVSEGNHFQLLFYTDKLLVMVHQENELQLINTFNYQTPEDVAYYVLSLCRLFEINPESANIHVSGLIDQESAISTELKKYLRNVIFGNPSEEYFQTEENDLESIPGHYFSYLVKLALCE